MGSCCIAFFGFMRVGEFTIPGPKDYDASIYLSFSDIAVNSRGNPRLLQVTIKQSKTDPFRRGVNIYLGAEYCHICYTMKASMKANVYHVHLLLGRVGEFTTILSAKCECAAGYVYCLQIHNAFICLCNNQLTVHMFQHYSMLLKV